MKIGGPFLDKARRTNPKKWFLQYYVAKLDTNGAALMTPEGKIVKERKRPYYETKADAEADKPRIHAQTQTSGTGSFVSNRAAQLAFESAVEILGDASLVVVAANYYRKHHPAQGSVDVAKAVNLALGFVKSMHGDKSRHYSDLKSRLGRFAPAFSGRAITSLERGEILTWLRGLPLEPRGILNHKRAVCNFFNVLLDELKLVSVNPIAGLKKNKLPKVILKEVRFLPREDVEAHLRTCERWDPELVAHETVQFFSGVRSDDEMENFLGDWILPQTREVVIPDGAGKKDGREVINELEENFWAWWAKYGRKGKLRPKNWERRWKRVRVLTAAPADKVETLAALPIKTLLELQKPAPWPWNARRRTFCTYHVAKHQSAAKTALILRQRGSSETLHDSYRGLGVTQVEGQAYFEIRPKIQNSAFQ